MPLRLAHPKQCQSHNNVRLWVARDIDIDVSGAEDFSCENSPDSTIIFDDVDGIGTKGTLDSVNVINDTVLDSVVQSSVVENPIEDLVFSDFEANPPITIDDLVLNQSPGTHSLETDPTFISDPTPETSLTIEPKPSFDREAPSISQILQFAIPAIGVWLCSPFLSMIDTSAVGLISGTAQQAALNPAVSVTEYAALLVAFMYTGTTNLIAEAREEDKGKVGDPKTKRVFKTALQLSTFVGGTLGAALLMFCNPLLRAIIGTDAVDPAVFSAAAKYVRIRALGMPAAVIIGSAQAACLGMKDIKSPLYVLATAAVVNFFGDVLLVGIKHPWIGGAAGAAWATVFSQYAALYMMMELLKRRPKKMAEEEDTDSLTKSFMKKTGIPEETIAKVDCTEAILEMTSPPSSRNSELDNVEKALKNLQNTIRTKKSPVDKKIISSSHKTSSPSVRGFLRNQFRKRDLLAPPSRSLTTDLSSYFLPVTTTQVGRVSSYIAMSHVISSSIGTVAMAAHQIIISLFYCLVPMADSLSQTAQTFVPGIAAGRKGKRRSEVLRKTSKNFMKAGALFGVVLSCFVGMIPLLSRFFTADAAVLSVVNSVVPTIAGCFLVNGLICAIEGILVARKDLSFLGSAYAGYFFAVPYFMLRVKKKALAGIESVGLPSVWKVFLGYQLVRVSAWVLRLALLTRRDRREAARLESAPQRSVHILSDEDDEFQSINNEGIPTRKRDDGLVSVAVAP